MTVVGQAMRAYYDRRASEYDDWWLGSGRFADRDRPGWAEEVEQLVDLLASLPPVRVLDVACGTGFLTRHLRGDVVALDQSARMLRIAGERMPHARLVQGDAVPLPFADGAFERVLTSHFYGHLVAGEREAFLREARRAGGELVVVDSALRDDVADEEWQERMLDDGSVHRVYKRFFTGTGLARELGGGELLHAGRWFVVVAAPALRRATPADAERLARFVVDGVAVYRSFAAAGWNPPPLEPEAEKLRALLADGDGCCLLAERDGRLLGQVTILPAARAAEPVDDPALAHLSNLFVSPELWGSGLAGTLHAAAVAAARERGFSALRLFTPAGQARARRFYEREGWTATGGEFHAAGPDLVMIEYRRELSDG